MANMARLRVAWAGTGVTGGGLSTFYFSTSSSGVASDVRDFFDAIKSAIPNVVTWSIPEQGDLIDDVTGDLTGSWSEGSGTLTVSGTSTATWAAGVGYRVVWSTAGIFKGRRVKGSTFICPISAAAYDTAGTIESVTLAGHRAAAVALVAAQPDLRIWSRPSPPAAGESNVVTSATIPDKVSWLRSRRV